MFYHELRIEFAHHFLLDLLGRRVDQGGRQLGLVVVGHDLRAVDPAVHVLLGLVVPAAWHYDEGQRPCAKAKD